MKGLRVIRSLLGGLVVVGCVAFAGEAAWISLTSDHAAPRPAAPARLLPRAIGRVATRAVDAVACLAPSAFLADAAANRDTLNTAVLAPFGAPESGWAIYAPLVAHEVGTPCGPETPGFAAAVARWRAAHGLPGAGQVDAPTLSRLGTTWLLRRPFVVATKTGCPASPVEDTLARADPAESFGGKTVLARPAALQAYRSLVEAAHQDLGGAVMLTIASAYRGPAEEAARCAAGGCGTPAKARCSAHRTGLAFDFYLGAPAGRPPFSTANDDRLFLSRTPTYRWLVDHADKFGFTPYPFEPWHWEWTGEPV